jgi:hypothetical protein
MGWVWVLLLFSVLRGGDLWVVGGERFARSANTHLNDDKTVVKMGHPDFVVDPDSMVWILW